MQVQQQQSKGVPMAMQIWKHRMLGHEVKVVWCNSGRVGWISMGCTGCGCPKEDQCDPRVQDLADFTDSYGYLRAF